MDHFVVRKGEPKNTTLPNLVHHLQAVSAQKGTARGLQAFQSH